MKILVIGGTVFVGRAYVDEAVGRGHEVTVFHRGNAEPAGLPEVEHLHGDRLSDLEVLTGRRWDVALDTCAYFPRAVAALGNVLAGSVGHYTLVSTLSVHPDPFPVGTTEASPVYGAPFPEAEAVTAETYGPLKVLCELEARVRFDATLVIRPGYIVGPHDPTGRFTSFVRRAAAGGEMLAPGPPEALVQVVDVRDLGTFMLDRAERRDVDTYGIVGPGEPFTMQQWLEASRDAAGADTKLTWVSPEFLRGYGEELSSWLPIWDPDPGVHSYDGTKALGAGLKHRPIAETIADTLAWDRREKEPPLRAGLSPEQEREMLAAWRSGQ